jgi:four helix bundle protein
MIGDMKEYQKFYQMDLWKDSFELQKEVFEITKGFPRSEEYSLTSQLNRSTNSVLANLAEAHGRYSYLDKIRVLYIARGEIEETQSHLIVAESRKYISRQQEVEFVEKYEKVKMKINKYINFLFQKNRNSKQQE